MGRLLWAAMPPPTAFAGRAALLLLLSLPGLPRALWVLMPCDTRAAGELMTAAARFSTPPWRRLFREAAISSPKPGTNR